MDASPRTLVPLAAATLGAWVLAWGTTRVLAPQIAPTESADPYEVVVPEASGPADKVASVASTAITASARSRPSRDPIVQRSIFDSSKIGLTKPTTTDSGTAAATDLDLVLVSTMVAFPAEFSSAWIGQPGSASSSSSSADDRPRRRRRRRRGGGGGGAASLSNGHGYAIGDTIVGFDAVVVAIDARSVTLERSNGEKEVLSMDKEETSTGRTSSRSKDGDDKEDGVEKVSEDHFTIERSVIEKLAEDPSQLAKLGRAVPHKDASGQVDGYRLSGIRRNSLGRKLGLRSGDVVHSINGYEMTSMGSAMSAYEALQSANNLDVEITRRGTKKAIKVDVE